MDALLANSNDLASATRVILLEIKSSTANSVPFSISLGSGYGGYQLDNDWLDGVITKMIGSDEVSKSIQVAGQAFRRIFENNRTIIEKYVIEVDKQGLAKIIGIN